ncbi:glycosyltransferase family 2 protein [Lysinibacillus sp. NPDC093190]|uniref:glycosyltransferase family 2 protein n=1 Tax=Lysinibacillus sp. NPDC093190 TaxID=3390575 RepID=UPI003D066B51
MSKGPKISIITACYNAEKTIEQTIQSVINQTYDNIEYIIIDGASTDGTMNIVEKYKDKIDKIISEPDEGIYDAFNKGVRKATGEYINFMNADDYFSENSVVKKVANYLYQHPHILMSHGDVKAFDAFTKHWHYRGESLTYRDFELGKMCPHQSVFTHNQLFTEFAGFDLRYGILADVDFTIKCFKKYENRIAYLPIEIAHFRLGGLSNTLVHEKKMHVENAIIHFNHFGSVPDFTRNILYNFETYQINQYYRSWLELLVMDKDSFIEKIDYLKEKKVAIFGTKNNATYLFHSLQKAGIEVLSFIDNDMKMQGKELHQRLIISPENIEETVISAIIISIERIDVALMIKHQLQSIYKNILVRTWHEII